MHIDGGSKPDPDIGKLSMELIRLCMHRGASTASLRFFDDQKHLTEEIRVHRDKKKPQFHCERVIPKPPTDGRRTGQGAGRAKG